MFGFYFKSRWCCCSKYKYNTCLRWIYLLCKILQQNLTGSAFTFYPDPYTKQNLFYRSDNATLARLGVPAHTISTSKMDSEPNYHKASDEVSTLDLDNMTMIIQAIAISSKSIVAGKETPSRVKVEELR